MSTIENFPTRREILERVCALLLFAAAAATVAGGAIAMCVQPLFQG